MKTVWLFYYQRKKRAHAIHTGIVVLQFCSEDPMGFIYYLKFQLVEDCQKKSVKVPGQLHSVVVNMLK